MMKLSQILIEQEEDTQPISAFERKIIHIIINNFYSDVDYDYDFDVTDWEKVYNFLTKKMAIPPHKSLEIYSLIYNHLEEIKSGDDNWKVNPIRGFNSVDYINEVLALSEFLITPPHLIEVQRHRFFNLEVLYNPVNSGTYAVGVEEDVDNTCKGIVENLTFGLEDNTPITEFLNSDLYSLWGGDIIIKHLYIPENMKHSIASEEARLYMLDEYFDDEDILRRAESIDPSIGDLWEKLQGKIEDILDLEQSENVSEEQKEIYANKIEGYEKEISDLAKSAENIIFDYEYEHALDRISNVQNFLYEMGYITKNPNRNRWIFKGDTGWSGRQEIEFPSYIKVNIEGMEKEMYEFVRENAHEEIASYDMQENIVEYDGVDYYIYRLD